MDLETDEHTGPVVVIAKEGAQFRVSVEPPLPSGDHRSVFPTRDQSWAAARALWTKFKLGLRDEADPKMCNHNALTQPLEK